METTGSIAKPEEREHVWIAKPGGPDRTWEERNCSVCHLEDKRTRRDPPSLGFLREWEVTTPCIEPVPEHVSTDEFKKELKEHGVRQRPLLIGLPGEWQIGFCIGAGGYHLYPIFKADTPEHGFSMLLTWLRARRYDVYRYSQFRYLDGLYTPDYHDDD